MNLEQILMAIQANVDRSNDDIEWEDEDIVVRIGLINEAIDRWAEDNTTEWQELCVNKALGTVELGANMFPFDEDYKFLQGVYLENGAKIPEKLAADAVRDGKYFHKSGNQSDGYNITLGWSINEEDKALGQELRVIYFRKPIYLINAGDIPEMSSPRYIVDFVTAQLMIDDDTTQYGKYANDAALELANMRQLNDRLSDQSVSHTNAFYDDMEGLGD